MSVPDSVNLLRAVALGTMSCIPVSGCQNTSGPDLETFRIERVGNLSWDDGEPVVQGQGPAGEVEIEVFVGWGEAFDDPIREYRTTTGPSGNYRVVYPVECTPGNRVTQGSMNIHVRCSGRPGLSPHGTCTSGPFPVCGSESRWRKDCVLETASCEP